MQLASAPSIRTLDQRRALELFKPLALSSAPPPRCRDRHEAPRRAAGWAYEANFDVETDTYEEPRVLFKAGTLPPGVAY